MAAGALYRRIFGDVDRAVLPVLSVTFIYYLSFSTFWVYVGVFVVRALGWHAEDVGLLFLACAPPAALANYLSGRVSDLVGRKRPIVLSFLAAAATTSALALLDHDHALAFGLTVLLGVAGAPAFSLGSVLVADLIPDQARRESGYAALRVAMNLAAFSGPPLAGLLIAAGGWSAFLIGISVLGLIGAAVSTAVLPSASVRARSAPDHAIRQVLRDRPFRLLLVSTLLGYVVYCGFETVLPVIAASIYGLSPATWGLLVIINPLLVVALQLRLTAATSRFSSARRLAVAMPMMGLPFLLLIAGSSVPLIAGVIVVFVLGEMVWAPTSQAIAARLAPSAARGSYLGAMAAMTGPAWTLTPLVALTLRTHVGIASIWILLALSAVAGAAVGIAAIGAAWPRGARARGERGPGPYRMLKQP